MKHALWQLPARLSLMGLAALTTSCGGGGGGGPTPIDPPGGSALFAPVSAFRRSIRSDGQILNDPALVVGDAASGMLFDVGTRAVMRFDLQSIPTDAVIVQAELRLSQTAIVGDPYGSLGNLAVAYVDLGAGVDATDYNTGEFVPFVGHLSVDGTLEQKTMNMKDVVELGRFNGRTVVDVRLQFDIETSPNAQDDVSQLEDPTQLPLGEDAGGLFVEWTAP